MRFNAHELSQFHIDSVKAVSQPRQDVAEMLSCAVTKEKETNGSMLMIIFQNLQFLSRQGLPLRGHDSEDSNFIQLLRLRGNDKPCVSEWLNKKADKYTSPEIQNEILALMSHMILRKIAEQIHKAEYFTLMADECVDIANQEQLAVCFRYVDDSLVVHEEFMGLYLCSDINLKQLWQRSKMLC